VAVIAGAVVVSTFALWRRFLTAAVFFPALPFSSWSSGQMPELASFSTLPVVFNGRAAPLFR